MLKKRGSGHEQVREQNCPTSRVGGSEAKNTRDKNPKKLLLKLRVKIPGGFSPRKI